VTHTTECLKAHEARQEYLDRWPDYCRGCGGSGEVHWQENQALLGSGLRWMEDFSEPCSCLYDGRCPRCGEGNMHATPKEACPDCGWTAGTPGCPEAECFCFVTED
jgi:hypothetical protein